MQQSTLESPFGNIKKKGEQDALEQNPANEVEKAVEVENTPPFTEPIGNRKETVDIAFGDLGLKVEIKGGSEITNKPFSSVPSNEPEIVLDRKGLDKKSSSTETADEVNLVVDKPKPKVGTPLRNGTPIEPEITLKKDAPAGRMPFVGGGTPGKVEIKGGVTGLNKNHPWEKIVSELQEGNIVVDTDKPNTRAGGYPLESSVNVNMVRDRRATTGKPFSTETSSEPDVRRDKGKSTLGVEETTAQMISRETQEGGIIVKRGNDDIKDMSQAEKDKLRRRAEADFELPKQTFTHPTDANTQLFLKWKEGMDLDQAEHKKTKAATQAEEHRTAMKKIAMEEVEKALAEAQLNSPQNPSTTPTLPPKPVSEIKLKVLSGTPSAPNVSQPTEIPTPIPNPQTRTPFARLPIIGADQPRNEIPATPEAKKESMTLSPEILSATAKRLRDALLNVTKEQWNAIVLYIKELMGNKFIPATNVSEQLAPSPTERVVSRPFASQAPTEAVRPAVQAPYYTERAQPPTETPTTQRTEAPRQNESLPRKFDSEASKADRKVERWLYKMGISYETDYEEGSDNDPYVLYFTKLVGGTEKKRQGLRRLWHWGSKKPEKILNKKLAKIEKMMGTKISDVRRKKIYEKLGLSKTAPVAPSITTESPTPQSPVRPLAQATSGDVGLPPTARTTQPQTATLPETARPTEASDISEQLRNDIKALADGNPNLLRDILSEVDKSHKT